MSLLLYYLLIKPISLLPLAVTYRLSPVISLILFRLVGYRKGVVRDNLKNSFSKLSDDQIDEITRKFYQHFGDIVVESIHNFSISGTEAQKRCVYRNPELLTKYYDQGRDIAMVGGHVNNWELFGVTIAMQSPYRTTALYRPLRDAFLNRKMQESRGKFGLELVNVNERHEMLADKSSPKIVVFGADQVPKNAKRAYWMDFLDQDTPVAFGAEKYAKEFEMVVIFGRIEKVRRGYYEIEFEVIEENAPGKPYGAITESFTRKIEQQIRQNPHQWIWTHRRWKRKRGEMAGPAIEAK